MSWLRKESNIDRDTDPPDHVAVRLAGHSSGGCYALLCAVELKEQKWKIDGVVTFGSLRVGKQGFKALYQTLDLQHCTVQFANKGDIVPWLTPESCDFQHVVENHVLGSIGDPVTSHQIGGSRTAYQHTLQDAVDGREGQSIATKVANAAAKYGPAVVSKAAGAMGVGALGRSSPASLSSVELQKLKQELRAEIALMRRSQSQELAALAACLFQEIEQLLRWNQTLEWLEDMKTWVRMVQLHDLEKWNQHAPHWFTQYKVCLGRVLAAAGQELDCSPIALHCIKMYLRAASCLLHAMISAGAPQKSLEAEFADFVSEASNLFCHLDPKFRNEVMQLLPGRFALPGRPILQIQNGSSFNLDVKIKSEEDLNSLWQLPEYMKEMMTSLSLSFNLPQEEVTDKFVQQLADWMMKGSTSRLSKLHRLALHFQNCHDITDASVQYLCSSFPSNFTSLHLFFNDCHRLTDQSLHHLFSHLSRDLAHLKLEFSGNNSITGTSFEQLAEHVPLGLTSMDLHFPFTDVCPQHLVNCLHKLPHLTSLALRFSKCHLWTDTSLQRLSRSLPQGLTSFEFKVIEFTDASLQPLFDRLQRLPDLSELKLTLIGTTYVTGATQVTGATLEHLATHLPPNLTSLTLEMEDCKNISEASLQQFVSALHQDLPGLSHLKLNLHSCSWITDATLHYLAEHLPQDLASLALTFRKSVFSDAPVQQLAQKLPESLTSLTLDFNVCLGITDVSVQKLAKHLPSGLTSLTLQFLSPIITDASVQQLANSLRGLHHLTSLMLDFRRCLQVSAASLRDLANRLPQRHQIQLVLNGEVLELDG